MSFVSCIGVGAQLTLGGKTFLPENMYEKLPKCPNFTWILPENYKKYPNFYDNCPKKITKFQNFA